MVGQTPESASEGLEVKPLEEKRWRLVYESGMAPRCLMYEYVSKGRRYTLSLCVAYDERGNPHPFGSIRLTVNNLKTYEFVSFKQISKYLERKKIPFDDIKLLLSLWSEW